MSSPANSRRESFVFTDAIREEVKFKGSLQGASGSGKTLGALLITFGIVGDWRRIAFADTENSSAKQYPGQVFNGVRIPSGPDSFKHLSFGPPYDTDRMIGLVESVESEVLDAATAAAQSLPTADCPNPPKRQAGDPRFDAFVFDSMSHLWEGTGGVLERVDAIGSPQGWKVMGPKLRRVIDVIRFSRLHFMGCMRTKTEYQIDSTVDPTTGKAKVTGMTKMGTKPVFRDGLDYDMTTVFRLDERHLSTTDKDRTNLFSDRPATMITPEIGRMIAAWCDGAVCQIGSAEWVKLRLIELAGYGGSIDGLATLWAQTASNKSRIAAADWTQLVAAKDASKARIDDKK